MNWGEGLGPPVVTSSSEEIDQLSGHSWTLADGWFTNSAAKNCVWIESELSGEELIVIAMLYGYNLRLETLHPMMPRDFA